MAAGLVPVAASTKVLVAALSPEFVSGETIRRMRGTLAVTATSAFFFHGAIGAFVANDAALTAGVGSLLDPVTDVAEDAWFWYQSFHGGAFTAEGSAGSGSAQVMAIDSKAMRRVEMGYSVAFVVANGSAVSTFSIALSLRVLGSEAS